MNSLRTNIDENSSRSIYLTKRPLIAPISSFASAFEDYLTPFIVVAPHDPIVFVSSFKRQQLFLQPPFTFTERTIRFGRSSWSVLKFQAKFVVYLSVRRPYDSLFLYDFLFSLFFIFIFLFFYFILFYFLIFLIFWLVFIFYFLLTKNKQPSADPLQSRFEPLHIN